MSILVLLLSMITFAFGSPINKEAIRNSPAIDVCANGGCFEENLNLARGGEPGRTAA